MPRRIIYIQNPTSGSHFRTIEGGGKGPRKVKKPPKSKRPKPPPQGQPFIGTGGAHYMPAPGNWFTHKTNELVPYYGYYDGPGMGGAYEQEFNYGEVSPWWNQPWALPKNLFEHMGLSNEKIPNPFYDPTFTNYTEDPHRLLDINHTEAGDPFGNNFFSIDFTQPGPLANNKTVQALKSYFENIADQPATQRLALNILFGPGHTKQKEWWTNLLFGG